MYNKAYLYLILYLIISIIWLLISAFAAFIHKESFLWTIVFVIFTFAYIPLAVYYIRKGENDRISQSILLTVAIFILYLIYQSIRSIIAVRNPKFSNV